MKRNRLWVVGLAVLALMIAAVGLHAAPQGNANVTGAGDLTLAAPPGGGQGGGGAQGGGAPAPQTLMLKQDGTKVSGTLSGGRGGDVPVDGSVSGNTFTFSVMRQGRDGNTMTINYTATVTGDSMSGKMNNGRGDREFTAKKK